MIVLDHISAYMRQQMNMDRKAPGALFDPREFLCVIDSAFFELAQSCFSPRQALADVLDGLVEERFEVVRVRLDHGAQLLSHAILARRVEVGLRNLQLLPGLAILRVRHIVVQQSLQLGQERRAVLEHVRKVRCRQASRPSQPKRPSEIDAWMDEKQVQKLTMDK